MKRLGRNDRYCAVREGTVASRLAEPGTPRALAGGVSGKGEISAHGYWLLLFFLI